MPRRFAFALFFALLLPAAARADAIIVKKGKKLDVIGMKKEIKVDGNAIAITPENIDIYIEASTGIIRVEGYNGVEIAKSAKAKAATFYPTSKVVRVAYSTEPTDLLDGFDQMRLGAYAQAIGFFRRVLDDPETRAVYKHEARFQIGICFLQSGRLLDAINHFRTWKAVNSKYTPEVQRILAEAYTKQKSYKKARARYANIPKLKDITDSWKFKAHLGAVKVSIAERKYAEAEQAAASIARETRGAADLNDARALALVLQADAIRKSGAEDRLLEAQGLLEKAKKITPGVSGATRAFLFVTLGDVLYSQRKLEEARFPYLRAALMYPGTNYEGYGFTNAGLCFLDLSGRFANEGNQEKSDEYLVKAMKQFAVAAGRYRNAEARKRYRANKQRYEELKAKLKAAEGEEK